ncbi:MAG: ACT domain-containing protein [Granulosicoccaceae bacterium]
MNKTLIITILATDRPGIVRTISEVLVAHNANWVDSRMANLADKFAGLVRISVATDQLHKLKDTMQALHDADNQLHILMEDADEDGATETKNKLSLELIGADRPGIIDDVTGVLVKLRVNIKELESEQREASMSSEMLFWAKLQLGLPAGVSNDDVQDALESLSDQLMVDINIDE